MGVQSSLKLAETESESEGSLISDIESNPKEHVYDNCIACKTKRQQAHSSNLPVAVVNGKKF